MRHFTRPIEDHPILELGKFRQRENLKVGIDLGRFRPSATVQPNGNSPHRVYTLNVCSQRVSDMHQFFGGATGLSASCVEDRRVWFFVADVAANTANLKRPWRPHRSG